MYFYYLLQLPSSLLFDFFFLFFSFFFFWCGFKLQSGSLAFSLKNFLQCLLQANLPATNSLILCLSVNVFILHPVLKDTGFLVERFSPPLSILNIFFHYLQVYHCGEATCYSFGRFLVSGELFDAFKVFSLFLPF